VAAGVDVVVAAYADGASTWTSHHVATPTGPAAVIDREYGPPTGVKVVAAAAGRVVAAAAGRVVAAAPAAGPTAHFTAVLTTQVNGRFAATSPTVTWPGE
jgi:hypothetical protein